MTGQSNHHQRGKHDPDPSEPSGYNSGITLLSYIIGGILVWSLVGWGLDNMLGTRWIALVGALVGAAGGLYLSHVHHLTRAKPQDPSHGVRDDGPARGDR